MQQFTLCRKDERGRDVARGLERFGDRKRPGAFE